MHFDASVTAGHELCTGFISPVVELGKLLKKGDPKGAMAVFEDERSVEYRACMEACTLTLQSLLGTNSARDSSVLLSSLGCFSKKVIRKGPWLYLRMNESLLALSLSPGS
mmetsp:Transcript_35193/g.61800  ORF Transcript_35193/g.61800 Transcript_35193/m.61800 type:complete len:110 (-) Transcript_35193:65-394(-)